MEIRLHRIAVRTVVDGYVDTQDGATGCGGQLRICTANRREFVYTPSQRDAVVRTVLRGFPLGVVYWTETQNWIYEVMDGKQRILGICRYVHGEFAVDGRYFAQLSEQEQQNFLSYKLMVYICRGSAQEVEAWRKTVALET